MHSTTYQELGARAIAEGVRGGRWTATEVVAAALDEIGRQDPRLNAFTVVLAEQARAEAARVDADESLRRGALAGVPIAVKAELDVAGQVTSFGGRANSTPAKADCRLVRCLREAGAVIVGITNMPEFGQFPFTEPRHFGRTLNPWSPEHTTGGSSGGSAAAVASGMVPVAIGGDGGGSIRIPASCCGLFGHKGSRGLVSPSPQRDFWGALAISGPLARTVDDSALVHSVIDGNEPTDRFVLDEQPSDLVAAAARAETRLRIVWTTKSAGGVPVDREVAWAVKNFAESLATLDHQVTELDATLPNHSLAYLPQMYGGMLDEEAAVEHPDRLEGLTRAALRFGRVAARPALRRRAEAAGVELAKQVDELLATADVLLTPTLACLPPPLGQLDGVGWARATWASVPMAAFTSLFNVTGHPACSVPAGRSSSGLPIGAQLVARHGRDHVLFALAGQVERELGWPKLAD